MPRFCVTSSTAEPVACAAFHIWSRNAVWMVTSSPDVGSSAISRRGLELSAIAISTRCVMPVDSSCGNAFTRRAGSLMPTRASISMARACASLRLQPEWTR